MRKNRLLTRAAQSELLSRNREGAIVKRCLCDRQLVLGGVQVAAILLVFLARVHHDDGVLLLERKAQCKRLLVHLGVFESHRPLHVLGVEFLEPFDQVQLIAVLVTGGIEPGAVADANRVDY